MMAQQLTQEVSSVQDVQNLPEPERKAIAEVALGNLGPGAQQDVVQNARVGAPGQGASDRIWTIIVSSFAIVLVGAFLSLAAIAVGIATGAGTGGHHAHSFYNRRRLLGRPLEPQSLSRIFGPRLS
jgi:hypothetical protein